jgi:predicted RNase H-related nuclease YkuK (DUF458 family)
MSTKKFRRGNGQIVTYDEMIQVVADYILQAPDEDYEITVGTDSQNHSQTKMVEVIAVHRGSQGGIFFYRTDYIQKITSLKVKILEETSRSLENAEGLLDGVGFALLEKDIDIDKLNIDFKIHCDVGYQGKTSALISEIVAWVHSCGYECAIKPESYTASGIANKFSK